MRIESPATVRRTLSRRGEAARREHHTMEGQEGPPVVSTRGRKAPIPATGQIQHLAANIPDRFPWTGGNAMTSPNTLATHGIARDLYRPGWHCYTCRVQLQNGLTGARAHYDQVHALAELDPPALYVLPR